MRFFFYCGHCVLRSFIDGRSQQFYGLTPPFQLLGHGSPGDLLSCSSRRHMRTTEHTGGPAAAFFLFLFAPFPFFSILKHFLFGVLRLFFC